MNKLKVAQDFMLLAFVAWVLAGCAVKGDGYEATIDTAILEEHTKQVQAKTAAAEAFALACKGSPPDFTSCAGDVQCVSVMALADALKSNGQTDCVRDVASNAALVAIKAPELRARGWAAVADSVFGKWLNNNTGVLAGAWLGKEGFSFGKAALGSMERTAINSGRPNIDNSVNTTTSATDSYNVSESNGNTTGSYNSESNGNTATTTIVDNGSQIGDGILAGGSVAGGSQCSGTQCQPVGSQNPIDNSNPPTQGIASPSPVADGICFGIWNAEAMAIDPDC